MINKTQPIIVVEWNFHSFSEDWIQVSPVIIREFQGTFCPQTLVKVQQYKNLFCWYNKKFLLLLINLTGNFSFHVDECEQHQTSIPTSLQKNQQLTRPAHKNLNVAHLFISNNELLWEGSSEVIKCGGDCCLLTLSLQQWFPMVSIVVNYLEDSERES